MGIELEGADIERKLADRLREGHAQRIVRRVAAEPQSWRAEAESIQSWDLDRHAACGGSR